MVQRVQTPRTPGTETSLGGLISQTAMPDPLVHTACPEVWRGGLVPREWINEIPTVPIYYLAKPQPRERAWQNQRGKKTLLSLTLV